MIDLAYQVEFQGTTYTVNHGDPFDRGSADNYYGRRRVPHRGGVGGDSGPRVGANELTVQDIAAYEAGYDWNEQFGDKKDWE